MNLIYSILITIALILTQNNSFATNRKMFYQTPKEKDITNYKLTQEDEKTYEQIKRKINNNQWFDAYKLEKSIQDEGFRNAINIIISLKKFKTMTNMSQTEIIGLINFNTKYYFLSEFKLFNKKIENYYLQNVVKYEDVKEYFKKFKSNNVNIIIKLLEEEISIAEKSTDKNKLYAVHQDIKKEWLKNNFDKTEQNLFLKKFGKIIDGNDLIKKAEIFVYERKIGMLENIIPLILSSKHKVMFQNILEMEKRPKIISHLIKLTARELRENDAFLFAQARYYRKTDRDNEVVDILLKIKNIPEYEHYWWTYKHIYVRELLKEKKYEKAYLLASNYKGPRNNDYVDAQWLAGWISLRFLKEYDNAYKHFHNIYNIVSYPVTVAKTTYWLARTAMEMNNEKNALKWYDISSQYTTTFYGQLSHYAKYNILIRNGEEYKNFSLPEAQKITEEDKKNVDKNEIVKLALLYYNYEGKRTEASEIYKELISKILKNKGEIAEVIEIVSLSDDEKLIVPLSKLASYKSVFFVDYLFPILRMVKKTDKNIALIHSIIKQESGFIVHAESSVGAIGFMQIMPATAKSLCKQLKITYNQYKLKHDPQYNIKLGSFYINQLVNQFNGSKILAIASYNAGPKATNKWIADFGDPRQSENMEGVIDWMESITYKETRNYVQRILENLIVYEYRLGINQ